MKKFLPIIFLASACWTNTNKTPTVAPDTLGRQNLPARDICDHTNTLTGKTETLQLYYIAWGCACANWATPEDLAKYQGDTLAEHCIFIEPATPALEVPLYFEPGRHGITVTGQFYVRSDYPKGTMKTEEQLDKARVFRYNKIEVFKKDIDYSPEEDTTVTLSYNAIGCTCAQWSYSSQEGDTKRDYLYLEPASDKLINADNLFKGNNLPLQIRVTGQIVSYDGYPTGFDPIKDVPKGGIVFRYTKIKVLRNGHAIKHTY